MENEDPPTYGQTQRFGILLDDEAADVLAQQIRESYPGGVTPPGEEPPAYQDSRPDQEPLRAVESAMPPPGNPEPRSESVTGEGPLPFADKTRAISYLEMY